jgi:hypothetical protein
MENCEFCGKQFKKGYTTQHQKAKRCGNDFNRIRYENIKYSIIQDFNFDKLRKEVRNDVESLKFNLNELIDLKKYLINYKDDSDDSDDEQEYHPRLF